ncbi:hypothetical protein Btru_052671 [Bulinus truncatus]|nr:hypothetical protein Btru_052671 [Bulinus truncatus]
MCQMKVVFLLMLISRIKQCLGKSVITVTDATKSICPNGSVVVTEMMKFKVKLSVEKNDIKHRILINIKNSKSGKVMYCNIDMDNCDSVLANSTCYCLLKEEKVFNAKVQIKASLDHNGNSIVAEHYEDELLSTTEEHSLPIIHGEPSAELEVNDVPINLQNCVMNLPSEEPYRVQFCTKNLFSPDLDIYWKTNDPSPTHSEKKECIRKRIPLAPNSTLLRFTYKDRCTRSQEFKCQVYGRSKSETTTFIVQGSCSERSRSGLVRRNFVVDTKQGDDMSAT